jgi:hypothetical protein
MIACTACIETIYDANRDQRPPGCVAQGGGLIDQAIRAELSNFADGDLVGISCLADGADQIFAREVVDLGGRLEVFVPAARYRDALPESAHGGYDDLIAQAVTVHRLAYVESTSQSADGRKYRHTQARGPALRGLGRLASAIVRRHGRCGFPRPGDWRASDRDLAGGRTA